MLELITLLSTGGALAYAFFSFRGLGQRYEALLQEHGAALEREKEQRQRIQGLEADLRSTLRSAETDKQRLTRRVDTLLGYFTALRLDVRTLDDGYWASNALSRISIQIKGEEDGQPEQANNIILMVARRLAPYATVIH
jgi:hypothetical protein